MSFYIVCQKKRNNPRMDIRICSKKCDMKDECAEYKAFSKSLMQNESVIQVNSMENIQMEAA
ncbi:MAG: hypothetical protein JXL81_10290 [Deltaproteobacteria bacterium]|nr:hypothetical protein [Deltaproteobacteria bacterium]